MVQICGVSKWIRWTLLYVCVLQHRKTLLINFHLFDVSDHAVQQANARAHVHGHDSLMIPLSNTDFDYEP